MSDSVLGPASVVFRPDPSLEVYGRLVKLVVERIEWWRAAIRGWASKKVSLTIPPTRPLTEEEKIVILAAFYDHHAPPAAQINPWREAARYSALPDDHPEPIPGATLLLQALGEGFVQYHKAVRSVPMLTDQWEANSAVIELCLVDIKRQIEAVPALTKEAAATLGYLAERHPVLSTLDDIEAGADISRSTAQKSRDELIEKHYAQCPGGPKKGICATTLGIAVAAKLNTKSAQT